MAEPFKKEFHTYRLSALDQDVARRYITIAFTYPCDKEQVTKAIDGFVPAVKRSITLMPQLAGILRPAAGKVATERGLLEVAVSREMIENFEVRVKYLSEKDTGLDYNNLLEKRFPSNKLDITQLAPLPQKPESDGGKAFAVQLNVIDGGIIVVLQQHHAVADIRGIAQVIRGASRSGAVRDWDNDTLREHAVGSSKARDLLSNSGGTLAPPNEFPRPAFSNTMLHSSQTTSVTCVLGFSMKFLEGTKDMINAHGNRVKIEGTWVNPRGEQTKQTVDDSHVLTAILWHGVVRARMAARLIDLTPSLYYPSPVSKIVVPVSIRNRVAPQLMMSYFGNAIVHGEGREFVEKLNVPLEPGWLQWAAQQVLVARNDITDRSVRVAIAKAHQNNYIYNINPTAVTGTPDVVMSDLSDVLPTDANLSLGLGQPTFVRKLSEADADDGCALHAHPAEGEDIWEVTVTLREAAMERLLADEGFMKFVVFADGERYVNGVTEFFDIGNRVLVQDEHERAQKSAVWRNRQMPLASDAASASSAWLGFGNWSEGGGQGGDGDGGVGGSGGVGAGPSGQPE